MENVTVPYELLVDLIEAQFDAVKNGENAAEYASIDFVVTDEQMFAKIKDKNPKCIYIVVRFGKASINFGQATLPLEMVILGVQNSIDITKNFLNEYVDTYNLNNENDITQLYMTPSVSMNFNEVYNGFRTLFSITSTFVIGNNTISLQKLQYVYENELGQVIKEDIGVISYNDSTENSLNPQPYPNNKGRTKSYGSFQTFAFTIVTYPDASKQLIQDIMNMKFGITRSHQNDTFKFELTFANYNLDANNKPQPVCDSWEFKCKSADFNQQIGEIPAFIFTFSL